MTISLPSWLDDVPEEEKPAARAKFLLFYCALYATQSGRVQDLAVLMGYNKGSLHTLIASQRPMNASLALKLENLLGREVITREILLPEMFAIPTL